MMADRWKPRLQRAKRKRTSRSSARILPLPAKNNRQPRRARRPPETTVTEAQGAGEDAVVVADAAAARMNAMTGSSRRLKPRSPRRNLRRRALNRDRAPTSALLLAIHQLCCRG